MNHVCRAVLFITLLVCASASGQAPKAVFNVADYGAVPGDLTGKSVDNALEAIRTEILARDAASNLPYRFRGATIKFPAALQPWVVGKPHWIDHDRWEIAGDGRETTKVASRQSWFHPAFIFGLPRNDAIPETLRPDSFGMLDTTAAPAAGQRWGIKITPDYGVSLPTSPFSNGPGDGRRYAKLRQHLTEVLIVPDNPAAPLPSGDLLGFDGWKLTALGNARNTLRLIFRVDVAGVPSDPQQLEITLGGPVASYRLAIQVDHDAGKVTAWCNSVQLPVSPIAGKTARFGPGIPSAYAGNDLAPFNLGFVSSVINGQVQGNNSDPCPLTIHGLRMASGLAYADSGTGSVQQRLDGQPITDFGRYLNPADGCFGLLPLTDPPGSQLVQFDAPCKPFVAIVHGFGFVTQWRKGNFPWVNYNTIRDITVATSGDPNSSGACPFGQGIAVGTVREFQVSRVQATGGAHGLGALPIGPSWTTRLDDVRLYGTDAGLFGYWTGYSAANIDVPTPMRTGLRLLGCGGHWQGVTFGDSAPVLEANIYCHGDQYGGNYRFDDVMADTEFGGRARDGVLVMECHPFTPCRLRVTNLDTGQIAPNAAPVVLRDSPRVRDSTTPYATIDGVSAASNQHKATVLRQSPKWGVSVTGSILFGAAARGGVIVPNTLDAYPILGPVPAN
jgi:hypothetical protein